MLYVGTSRDLRTRVRSYFTASETRTRMGEMVGLADRRSPGIECATPLEAEVRELRLIAEHKPRYNRRSRFPEKVHFIKLTREPWPRLSLVRRVLDDDADYLGPVLVEEDRRAVPGRAARHLPGPAVLATGCPRRRRSRACVLAEMGRCLSPCDGSVDADDVRRAWCAGCATRCCAGPTRWSTAINARMAALAADERFEEAGVHRDRLAAFLRAAARTQRLAALTRCPEVVAARREDDGGWAVHVVRHGRLAAAGVIPSGARRRHSRRASCRPAAETVAPGAGPDPGRDRRGDREDPALAGVRRASAWCDVDGEWTCPVGGRHPAPARCTTPSTSPGSPWCPSTTAASCARCTNRSASVAP